MFSQLDPKWSQVKLGSSPCTMGRFGCTTCSICNLTGITPDIAARKFKYTPDGLLEWSSDFSPLKFVSRVRGFDKEQERQLREWLNTGGKAILHVKNSSIPFHWVTADRVSKLGFITAIDPIGDKALWNVKAKYTVLGYALFSNK